MRGRAELTKGAAHAESADDDEMRVDLAGERHDLFVRATGANMKPCSPVGAARDGLESFEHETRELGLRVFDGLIVVVADDVKEVNVGCGMARGLVERVLEDDLGILGEVERDDDAIVRVTLHSDNRCIAYAAFLVENWVVGALLRRWRSANVSARGPYFRNARSSGSRSWRSLMHQSKSRSFMPLRCCLASASTSA